MSYLRFDGFTLKILCIAWPNRGTCKSLGPGTRRRDIARARASTRRYRASAVRRCTTAGPRSLGMHWACVSLARTSTGRLDRWAGAPCGVRVLAAAPSVRPPRTNAKAARTRALKCRGGLASKRGACARISYKRAPPSLPACENRRPSIRHRRRRHELALPQAPTADQPILALL
jgi:hypothetical protein